MMDAVAISRTALDVEWQRLQVIAENLANINSTRAPGGEPFRARHLVSGPQSRFERTMVRRTDGDRPRGVEVTGLTTTASGVRRAYEPGHPHADATGFVTYPDLDHAAEMALLIKASRAYEANLTAMSIAQQMYSRALGLGK